MRKMGARTLVKELLEPNEEIEHEFEDIRTRLGADFRDTPKAHRLTFFAAPCDDENWRDLPSESILGYAVILDCKLPADSKVVRDLGVSPDLVYVLEAVTRPPCKVAQAGPGTHEARGITNYYVHCHARFPTTIGGEGDHKEYAIHGAFFCQQNAVTHVCAHAALRMLLNTGRVAIAKVTNRFINDFLDIDHVDHVVPPGGLSIQQINDLARHPNLGLNPIAPEFIDLPQIDYARWVYPLVESGCPVLLGFWPTHSVGHVVAVVGHTMNSDKWDCEAELMYRPEPQVFAGYHASAAWVDHFIIQDDNFGMYVCMPLGYLRNKISPWYDLTRRARFGVAFMPSRVEVPPYSAEVAAVQLVANLEQYCEPGEDNKWLRRVFKQTSHRRRGVVARTVLCTRTEYLAHLIGGRDSHGKAVTGKLPAVLEEGREHIWLTEISLPDLYAANKHKIGDILTDANYAELGGQPIQRFVWGWLPGIQIRDSGDGLGVEEWPLSGHVPLLRSESVLGPAEEW